MTKRGKSREMSASVDPDGNSDVDSMDGSAPDSSNKKVKLSKDVQERKVQNRIAQREFRSRKQQYIKDLEARVSVFESSKDDQLNIYRNGLTALMTENAQLRGILNSLSTFIGQGLGGVLPQLNLQMPEFQSILSATRSDLVLKTISELSKPSNAGDSHASTSSNGGGSHASTSKQPRKVDDQLPSQFDLPPSPYTSSNSYQNFAPHCNPNLPPFPTYVPPTNSFPPNSQPPIEDSRPPIMISMPGNLTGELTALNHEGLSPFYDQPTDNPKMQAIQLISYHMRNKRQNKNYHLPPSLLPTNLQQSVAHDEFYDGIIFGSLRDRLILCKDQYHLPTLLRDFVDSLIIHDEDILLPANWELNETFLKKYWFVIDLDVLQFANRWRKERGQNQFSMNDLIPDGEFIAEGNLGKKKCEGVD